MPAYSCPKGHESADADFCGVCGAKMRTTTDNGRSPRGNESCPDCAAPRAPDSGAFCEVCGFNFSTGAHGEIPLANTPPPPAAAALPTATSATWSLLVGIDPAPRDATSPEPPTAMEPFAIPLRKPVNLIGRRSDSRAIFPEISLDYDDAVSHRHAVLNLAPDGSLTLRDIGSVNGTRLNGGDLDAMIDAPLRDGDKIALGHWTLLTVRSGD